MSLINNKKFDYIFKIIVVGEPHVGKSNVISRFCDGYFNDEIISTIGIDFRIKTITIDNKQIKIQIWDTAGQEKYKSMLQSYYNGADGVLFIFDLTQKNTLDRISEWYTSVYGRNDNAVTMLVGNKVDLYTNELLEISNSAYELAQSYNIRYVLTSAKNGENIDNLFFLLVHDIINKKNPKKIEPTIVLTPENINTQIIKNNNCC
jgi:Ras-related protein Rab-1A